MTTITEPTVARGSWLHRHRGSLLIGAGVVVATVLTILTTNGSPYNDPLDPANADPAGARAIAKVLEHQGVSVDIVRGADEFRAATTDAGTTVVITSTGSLGRSTAALVRDQASESLIVLVDPEVGVPTLFDLPEGTQSNDSLTLTAACSEQLYDGLTLQLDRWTSYPSGGTSCFEHDGESILAQPYGGMIELGVGDLLANDQITRADNAAFALRLLGQHPHLVWYVPDANDNTSENGTSDGIGISSILPRWLKPGLWLLGICVLALMLVRGRRLGALVTEPLPVVVTAIETTRSRGRLYRKINDRGHAAEALRRAARRRLAVALNLPRNAVNDPETLVRDIAGLTGFDSTALRILLLGDGTAPRTDKDLTDLANALADLTKEVRRP